MAFAFWQELDWLAFAGLERLAAMPPFTRHFGGLPGRFKPFTGNSEMAAYATR